jgi:uncharacterized protein (TIGR02145 family)
MNSLTKGINHRRQHPGIAFNGGIHPVVLLFSFLFLAFHPASSSASSAFLLSANQIYGLLSYNNNQTTPLAGVPVHLRALPGYIVASDTTDASGAFHMADFPDGTYFLDADVDYEPGGVNTTDALTASRFFANVIGLPPLKIKAGDVNGNGILNNSDALVISRLATQIITVFNIGQFVQSHPTVNFQSDTLNVNLWVLSAGDVNGSYAIAPAHPTLSLDSVHGNGASIDADVRFLTPGSGIYERGICWSTFSQPSITDQKAVSGRGSFDFSIRVTGFTGGTTYYFRAYATHALGTNYSNEKSLAFVAFPSLETLRTMHIGDSSVRCEGVVHSDGGSSVFERGFVYDTQASPLLPVGRTPAGSGLGLFSDTINGLSPFTRYYFRAYAQNAVGTAYGHDDALTLCLNPSMTSAADSICLGSSASFTAHPIGGFWRSVNPSVAVVDSLTGIVTGVSAGSAEIRYVLSLQGGCPMAVAERFIHITAPVNAGTLSGNQNLCVGSTDTYASTVTGGTWSSSNTAIATVNATTGLVTALTPGTATITYTVTGTGGCPNATATRSLTVCVALPGVSTTAATAITSGGASTGGMVTSSGGAIVSARGVAYGTSANPTLANQFTMNGSGLGSFTSQLSGLTPGTAYRVRAYATNAAGTAYGNEVMFSTTAAPFVCGTSQATDVDGNNYATMTLNLTINSQLRPLCWFKQSLRVSKYRNGDPIPTGLDTSAWRRATSGAVASPNDSAVYDSAYGKLYNWYALADTRGICPTGWHVATDAEYLALTNFCQNNGYSNTSSNRNGPGRALKSCRQINTPYSTACNTSIHPRWLAHNNTNPHYGIDAFGFSALPAGARVGDDGTYQAFGGNLLLQTPNLSPTDLNYGYLLRLDAGNFARATGLKTWGGSVRCVRDY